MQGALALSCRRPVYGNSKHDAKCSDRSLEGFLLLRWYFVVEIGGGQIVVYRLGIFETETVRLATITGAKMRYYKLEIEEDENWRGWQECFGTKVLHC